MRRMANSVNDEVVGFNSALKEASVFPNLTFLVHQNRKKKKQLLHWFWKGSTGRVAKWLWEKPDASGVGSYERNYDGETFERSCRFSAPTYCLWSNGIDIFDRVSGSYAHGLAIILEDIESGKYQLVFASAENVLVKPFLSLMKTKTKTNIKTKNPDRLTRVCRFASNKLWRVKLRMLLFVLQSIVYDQLEEKQSNRLTAAILKDYYLENLECRKHQLIFGTAGRFLRSSFVPGWKKKTTLLFHSSTLCVFFL